MRRLAPLVGEVHGLDVSSEMIARGRAMAASENMQFHLLTSTRFEPLTDAAFDFAYSFAVFQHIPDKQVVDEYFHEVFRVLKPGGVFAAQFCMREHAYGEAETWAGVVYNRREVCDLAKRAGFRLVSLDGQSEQYIWAILIKAAGGGPADGDLIVKLHGVWPAADSAQALAAWGPGCFGAASLSGLDRCLCDITGIDVECSGFPADVTYFGPTVYTDILQINFLVPESLRPGDTHRLKISALERPRWSVETLFALAPDPPEAIELVWISDGEEVTSYWKIPSRIAKVQVKGIREPRDLRLRLSEKDFLEPEAIASVNSRLGWYELNFRLPGLQAGEMEVALCHVHRGEIQSAKVTVG